MQPEKLPSAEARHRAEQKRRLIPKIVDVVRSRLGMDDEVLDAPVTSTHDITVDHDASNPAMDAAIENRLAVFREAKKGTAEADMITPLQGAEQSSFYYIKRTDEDTVGTIVDGYKVSAAGTDGTMTMFKPYISEDGALHVETANLTHNEFIRMQDVAIAAEFAASEAKDAKRERLLQIDAVMTKLRDSQNPGWNTRHDLQ